MLLAAVVAAAVASVVDVAASVVVPALLNLLQLFKVRPSFLLLLLEHSSQKDTPTQLSCRIEIRDSLALCLQTDLAADDLALRRVFALARRRSKLCMLVATLPPGVESSKRPAGRRSTTRWALPSCGHAL